VTSASFKAEKHLLGPIWEKSTHQHFCCSRRHRGWFTGAALGAAVGSSVPVIGTAIGGLVGGILGGLTGGVGASGLAKKGLDCLIDDDARKMLALVQKAVDEVAVLLNEEDNEAAVKKISAMDKPPESEPSEIYGITGGSFDHEDGLWKTTIRLKDDLCIYDTSHPSGHFKKVVWKKGIGLLEYASGYGAHADGYCLKRTTTSQKQ
jgi:hypothetical protein